LVDALSVDIQLDEDGSFETGKLTNTSPPIVRALPNSSHVPNMHTWRKFPFTVFQEPALAVGALPSSLTGYHQRDVGFWLFSTVPGAVRFFHS
jgi:hypothetical protein